MASPGIVQVGIMRTGNQLLILENVVMKGGTSLKLLRFGNKLSVDANVGIY